jgi:hypothetical protein
VSHPYQPQLPAGPQLPSEFKIAGGGFGRMLGPFIAVLVMGFLVGLLLGAIITQSTIGGIGIGAAFTLLLVGILYRKFARMKAGTVVRFSPHGVELSDRMGFHLRLRWPDMLQVGTVATQMANPGSVGVNGGMQVRVGAMQSLGLIGWGERMIPPSVPAWVRANLDSQPRNPQDGRPLVSIALGGIEPDWPRGAMGAWVRRYRPDLMAQAGLG